MTSGWCIVKIWNARISGDETLADDSPLDDYRFQFGRDAGNLSQVLDQLNDALRIVNQHTVYCRVDRGERAGKPPRDILDLIHLVETSKALVQETLLRLKAASVGE